MTYDDGRLLLGIVSTSKLNDDEVDSEESEWLGTAIFSSLLFPVHQAFFRTL